MALNKEKPRKGFLSDHTGKSVDCPPEWRKRKLTVSSVIGYSIIMP
jgi:hypothetical protein